MKIMDLACAESGAKIGKTENLNEALVNRALGVLQEDGLYAFFLFLATQSKKEEACAIQEQTKKLLCRFFPEFEQAAKQASSELLEVVRNKLTTDLNTLFLARDLVERTLIYARYHLKAKGEQS